MSEPRRRRPETLAARAGLGAPGQGGTDLVPPLNLAAVRAYAGLAEVDVGMETRDAYRRYGGGTPELLETALVELEGGHAVCRVTSSGQSALLLAALLLLTPTRRRALVLRPCYGGTEGLFTGPLSAFGVQVTYLDLPPDSPVDAGALVAAACAGDTAVVVCELITNPLMRVVDVGAVAEAAHAAGAVCLVDSTLATPLLARPLELGADSVFHSLTKMLSGHSDVLGGALLLDPSLEAAGWLDGFARLAGVGLAPFDAYLALRGLRTAGLRVERASANAAALAGWLAGRAGVERVHYPGTHGAQDEALAATLLPDGRGAMLGIELAGGRPAAERLLAALEDVRLAPSLGDVATTVSHPGLTSHRGLSREQRAALGISDGLVRVSVGVEALADLQTEFDAALCAAVS